MRRALAPAWESAPGARSLIAAATKMLWSTFASVPDCPGTDRKPQKSGRQLGLMVNVLLFLSKEEREAEMSKNIVVISVLIVSCFCFSEESQAQVKTDAAVQVQNLLNSFGTIPVTETLENRLPKTRHRRHRERPITTEEFLTASNIVVVSGEAPVFGDPMITTLPTVPAGGSWIWANCSEQTLPTFNNVLQISEQRQAGISISNGITHTESGQVGFTFTPPSAYGGFGFNGSISSGNSWTTTTTNQTSFQTQYTTNQGATVQNLKDKMAVNVTIYVDQLHITVPFSMNVIVDADVSENDKGLKKLSDVFPNSSDHRLELKGAVSEVNWTQTRASTTDIQFSPDLCVDQPGKVATIPLR